MAGTTQLYDPEFLFRSNTFTSFVTTWLIRYADPRKAHPKPVVEFVFPFFLFLFAPDGPVKGYPFQRRFL
jgi:hypothetical protein